MIIKPRTVVLDPTDLYIIQEALDYQQTNAEHIPDGAYTPLIQALAQVLLHEADIDFNPQER